MKIIFTLLFVFVMAAIAGCGNNTSNSTADTKLENITVAVDESFKPVIEEQLKVFDSSFPNIKVNIQYLPEKQALKSFLEDSAILVLATRDALETEREYFLKKGIRVQSLAIAQDGIAVIVNNSESDTLFTKGQLVEIIQGRFKKQFTVVFDNAQSSTVQYILDSLIPGQQLPSNVYAVQGNEAVIDYVTKNKNAIGFLGASYVFDREDRTGYGNFINTVKIAHLRNDSTLQFSQPYQGPVALKEYPLYRRLYFISREGYNGPAATFANFISGQRGQLIFARAYMVPLRVPLNLRETVIK